MRTCTRCRKTYAEVVGAEEQACPHCGLAVRTPAGAVAKPFSGKRADPVAAAGLAFRLWVKHPFALLLLWLPAFAANALASLLFAWYGQTLGLSFESTPIRPEDLGPYLRFLGVALPVTLAAVAVELSTWAMIAAWVEEKHGRTGRLSGLRERIPTLVAFGVLLSLTYAAGLALLVVPFFVFFHWFLFAPSALADGRSFGKAFEASREFARDRQTYGFTLLVILVWLGVYVVDLVLGAGLTPLFLATGMPEWAATALGTAVSAWPLAPLVPLLPAAYWTLARVTRESEAVPLSPVGPAAERFRTTKCPQCGTLVPYTATGQPVEVTCPVCGRAGKVL